MMEGPHRPASQRMLGGGAHTPVTQFPLVALVGPTAVGKTALALRLAVEIRAEIVSVDSVQVYRGLDIGTAKPTRAEQAAVPHHLIDVLDPDEPFDAADFAGTARRLISAIRRRGRNCLLVGGTGLYLRALIDGLAPCPGGDPAVRKGLRRTLSREGHEALHRILERKDPEASARIHPRDSLRVIRALEVYELTQEPISAWRRRHRQGALALPCVTIGLARSRQDLYSRIDQRVDVMLAQGLLQEVRGLLDRGYDPGLKPLQSLGYRHMIRFLRGDLTWNEALSQMKRDTRRYAKRQLTWFRADPRVRWSHPDALSRAEAIWPALWTP